MAKKQHPTSDCAANEASFDCAWAEATGTRIPTRSYPCQACGFIAMRVVGKHYYTYPDSKDYPHCPVAMSKDDSGQAATERLLRSIFDGETPND